MYIGRAKILHDYDYYITVDNRSLLGTKSIGLESLDNKLYYQGSLHRTIDLKKVRHDLN